LIVGSGLMAGAFAREYAADGRVLVYAAGVADSSCADPREFLRERERLEAALRPLDARVTVVYFGTCSVSDPDVAGSPYVRHKLAMEALLRARGPHLILRLPQVAGRTPNPHTLLNYLYARIKRSERFSVWGGASRSVIDVGDVAALAGVLLRSGADAEMVNLAPARAHSIEEIVAALERVTGKRAIYDVLPRGSAFAIDTRRIVPLLGAAGVDFGGDYLGRTLQRYYA
jgi:NAD dependent epimerase/dehydratase family